MGDSEDEFDRRRRDKFRGERTGEPPRARADDREYEARGRAPPPGAGGQVRSRGDCRIEAYRSGRYSPEMSPPPQKRQRGDWPGGERRGGGDAAYPGGTGIPAPPVMGYSDSEGPTQPPMMTFKAFLGSQDDMITDEEAIKKYTEYKLEFKRQQLNEFFLAHKEEEWFKAKYHPEECVKRQEEQLRNLQRRVEVFMEKLRAGALPALDGDNADPLLYLLDSVVIRLEGGTDLDLRVLEQEETPAGGGGGAGTAAAADNNAQNNTAAAQQAKKKADEETKKEEDEDPSKLPLTEEQRLLQEKAKQFLQNKTEEIKKRKYETGSGSSSDSDSDADGAAEPAPPGADAAGSPQPPAAADEKEEGEESTAAAAAAADQQQEKPAPTEGAADVENGGGGGELPRPRPLHKTSSIFLRNLAPTITKQEVEAMCRRYPGFLRAAIADPQPERRWFRRGWVTFERQVNIKEICWNLNNIRLRDCELGAIVNRDLSRRVRTVNGIASHKQVVRADIKLAAKIVQNLDQRYKLWPDPDADDHTKQPTYGVSSKNPVMRNITDYLIEEASAEEEELLGVGAAGPDGADAAGTETIERDEELIKVLDRLLLYLRIVHSVDYYNHSEYPNEDEMPNRCGIVHARGMPPSSKVMPQELQDYISSFENKISSFMQPVTRLQDDDCKRTGLNLKDPEQEVEKFVQANTQELAKDKWLCPLSNKKFKGPDFVRKHIFNKHAEKVDEVKKEVEFFNNYLRDPKRPQLPEHPSAKAPPPRKDDQGGHLHGPPYGPGGPPPPPHHGFGGGAYGGGYAPHQRGAPVYGGYQAAPPARDPYYREPYLPPRDAYPRPPRPYGGRRHVRPLNSYRDLDAPKDMDEF